MGSGCIQKRYRLKMRKRGAGIPDCLLFLADTGGEGERRASSFPLLSLHPRVPSTLAGATTGVKATCTHEAGGPRE